MQTSSNRSHGFRGRVGIATGVVGLLCCVTGALAQSRATNQTMVPGSLPPGAGTRAGTGCAGQDPSAVASNAADVNCTEMGPNFATPSAGVGGANRPRLVTSIIRVDATVPKPPVALPPGDTFNVVGSATLVKTHRPALEACLATGKRWSARSKAATSTTCLDPKGEVIAYQECKASSGLPDCTVVMAQQESARTP